MKKMFPLMFALVFANQVFAIESEAVEPNALEALTKAVELDEVTKAEAVVICDALRKEGLTNEQIITAAKEELRNETTDHIWDLIKNKPEVWISFLIGVGTTLVTYGIITLCRMVYRKIAKRGHTEQLPESHYPADDILYVRPKYPSRPTTPKTNCFDCLPRRPASH